MRFPDDVKARPRELSVVTRIIVIIIFVRRNITNPISFKR